MPAPNMPGESFSAGVGGKSTPPDFYSTMAQNKSKPMPEKKDNPGDEAIKALQAVFEVFKKLEAKLGGKPDPNLDAAKDNLKKFVAITLKQDPAMLDGAGDKAAAPPPGGPPPDAAQPPPPDAQAAAAA